MIKNFGKYLGVVAAVSMLAACQYQTSTTTRTVYFDSGSSRVNSSGSAALREAADILVMNQSRFHFQRIDDDQRIVTPAVAYLSGHTDTVGNAAKNQKLSDSRVNSVKSALIEHGAKPSALIVSSYGENKPAVQTKDNVKEGKNRRVEIRIVQ